MKTMTFAELVATGGDLPKWWDQMILEPMREVCAYCHELFAKLYVHPEFPHVQIEPAENFKPITKVILGGFGTLPLKPNEADAAELAEGPKIRFGIDRHGQGVSIMDAFRSHTNKSLTSILQDAVDEAAWTYSQFVLALANPLGKVTSWDGKPTFSRERGNLLGALTAESLHEAHLRLRRTGHHQDHYTLLCPGASWVLPEGLEAACAARNITIHRYEPVFGEKFMGDLFWLLARNQPVNVAFLKGQIKPILLLQTFAPEFFDFRLSHEYGGVLVGHEDVAGGKIL